jgi:DNA-binding transcriptional regulator YiaG
MCTRKIGNGEYIPWPLSVMEQNQSPKILVYEMRKRLRLTQKDFAARLGVTFISINRWENAKSQPSKMAMKLLKRSRFRFA